MAWFTTKHPLELSEKVALEHHLYWISRHFGYDFDKAPVVLTSRSPEISDLQLEHESQLPRLADFVLQQLPFQVSMPMLECVPDDANLDKPPYIDRSVEVIYYRQSQLLNLEEMISHLAYGLSCYYLNQLEESEEFAYHSPWLAELVPAYFGFGVILANAALRTSSAGDGQHEHWVHVRFRNVPARIFGVTLGYLVWRPGVKKFDWETELCADARVPFQQTLRFLSKSDDVLVSPRRNQNIFDNTNIQQLLAELKDKSESRRLAALLEIQGNIESGRAVIDEVTPTEMDDLLEMLRDSPEEIRQVACAIVASARTLNQRSVQEITELLIDESEYVQVIALQALAKHASNEWVDSFRVLRLLGHDSPQVAAAAVEVVDALQLTAEDLPLRLLTVLRRMLNQGYHDLAINVCGALHHATGDAASEFAEYLDPEELPDAMEALRTWRGQQASDP